MDTPGRSLLSDNRRPETTSRANHDDQVGSSASSALTIIATTWDRVRTATASDVNMNQLITSIKSGIPQFLHELSKQLQEYQQSRHSLYTMDGDVIYINYMSRKRLMRKSKFTSEHCWFLETPFLGVKNIFGCEMLAKCMNVLTL